jgi:predicted molibdopterin-dependent oxidoreductase YjgC
VLRADVTERIQPGVVYTTFHFPESGANVITTDSSDWATNCPEYKVTAVQVMPVAQPSEWQRRIRASTRAAGPAGRRTATMKPMTPKDPLTPPARHAQRGRQRPAPRPAL